MFVVNNFLNSATLRPCCHIVSKWSILLVNKANISKSGRKVV